MACNDYWLSNFWRPNPLRLQGAHYQLREVMMGCGVGLLGVDRVTGFTCCWVVLWPAIIMENLSSNVELGSGAFPISVQLFEHANQIVACLITRVAHWHNVACVHADWFSCWVTYFSVRCIIMCLQVDQPPKKDWAAIAFFDVQKFSVGDSINTEI